MPTDLQTILDLRVPVIVQIGTKAMSLEDVMSLGPGSIIELPKNADDPLTLLINNIDIALGNAVKVGENFGLRVSVVGSAQDRIKALANGPDENEEQ